VRRRRFGPDIANANTNTNAHANTNANANTNTNTNTSTNTNTNAYADADADAIPELADPGADRGRLHHHVCDQRARHRFHAPVEHLRQPWHQRHRCRAWR
jgi:hypothetical protein